jgi:hypothetical protein
VILKNPKSLCSPSFTLISSFKNNCEGRGGRGEEGKREGGGEKKEEEKEKEEEEEKEKEKEDEKEKEEEEKEKEMEEEEEEKKGGNVPTEGNILFKQSQLLL